MAKLVAGTNYRGQFEERLESLLQEAEAEPNLVIFIDEIHLMMGAGQASGNNMDAANILKPALARGTIRVIGATTTSEYRRHIEKDPAVERRFHVLRVSEPTNTETTEILQGIRTNLEAHHKVKISDCAIG